MPSSQDTKLTLAIDPSINNIGCCLVNPKGQYQGGWTLKTKGANVSEKAEHISLALSDWLLSQREHLGEIIIEHTRFFARNNNSSHASAQKLNLAKGILFGLCRAHCPDIKTHLVWIPGFNKAQAQLIAKAFRCPAKMSQHEIDAFWLANHWALSAEAQKKIYLESPN